MPGFCYKISVVLLAFTFGYLHRWHVSTMFENDRHFSHLSDIEREMSFRTEMGMYYYYFKVIAESKSFQEGLEKIRHDRSSEYPNVVNVADKYSLLPEIIIGFLYHTGKELNLFKPAKCWQIDRGDDLPPIESCEGLIVPIYFYLEVVWLFAAATTAILFLYATHLSDSIYGGLIAITAFFMNHNECTRVQWTPPLRETFAYPLLLFQMYQVTTFLKYSYTNYKKFQTCLVILCSTLASLECWQFSQFAFFTQLIAILILKWFKIIPNLVFLVICLLHGYATAIIAFDTGNSFYYHSLYASLLFYSICFTFITMILLQYFNFKYAMYVDIFLTILCTRLIKSFLFKSEDDAHIFNILKAKLTGYKDFHTLLYTCSPEFDFLKYETYESIIQTLLLPTVISACILTLYYWYRNFHINNFPRCIEPDVAYNYLQTGAFFLMAVFIMRLKLFMTPHLCLIAALVAKKQYLAKIGVKNENIRSAFVALLLAGMVYNGLPKLQTERSYIGEFSNIDQEQMFEWIKMRTPRNAAFAGKMSLMANVMLSTGRRVVNNPYYENKEMRDRTFKVYEIYSRKNVSAIYDTLNSLKVDYVIIDRRHCYNLISPKVGCNMIDLWDVADNEESKKAGNPPVCPILFHGNIYPFRRVFINRSYVILSLDKKEPISYPKSVELDYKPNIPISYQA